MDIKNYLMQLKGNLWIIVTTIIVTVAVVTGISYLMTPIYSASTTLRVAIASSGVTSYSDYLYEDRLMNTYIELITSSSVMGELSEELNTAVLPDINVELIPNTELIRVTADSQDPQVAQSAANALAKILMNRGINLYSGGNRSTLEILSEQVTEAEEELQTARDNYESYSSEPGANPDRVSSLDEEVQLKENVYDTYLEQYNQAQLEAIRRNNVISVVEPASTPLIPSRPNKILNIGLGFLLGLIGGIGLAFFFENLNGTKLYTSKQIAAVTGLPIIGKIPSLNSRELNFKENPSPPVYDAFRRLQVQLLLQNRDNPNKVNKIFMITSSQPGEGKSTITANLAISIAKSGKKVIVVDCDLINPMQHKIFSLPNQTGLTTILNNPTTEKVVQKTRYAGLFVITSGPILSKSTEILGSPKMATSMALLSQQFDIVLLDAPAFLAVADSAQLVSIVDGVALVVRRNQIREEVVIEACRQFTEVDAPMIGLIVNDAERR